MNIPDLVPDEGVKTLPGVVAIDHEHPSQAQRQIGWRTWSAVSSIGRSAGRNHEVFVRDADGKGIANWQDSDVWAAWLEHKTGAKSLTFTLVPWTRKSLGKSGPFTVRCDEVIDRDGLLIWQHNGHAGGWVRKDKLQSHSIGD